MVAMINLAMAKKNNELDPQVQFLVMSLTNVVTEAVEAKCQTISPRERKTLERRILKAVQLFVARPGVTTTTKTKPKAAAKA